VWGHRWIVAGDHGERDNRTGPPAGRGKSDMTRRRW